MIDIYIKIEVFIAIWYIKEMVFSSRGELFPIILVLLSYSIIKTGYYILLIVFPKNNLPIFIAIFIMVSGFYIYYPITFFLGLNLLQQKIKYGLKRVAAIIITAVYPLVVTGEYYNEYLIINSLVIIFLLSVEIYNARLSQSISYTEKLESQIEQLIFKYSNDRQSESEQTYTARVEERNLIAQKLHDELGHLLSGNIIQLEAASQLIDDNINQTKEILNLVINSLRNGSDNIRRILKKIKPEPESINIQRVKALISDIQKRSGIEIQLFFDQDVTFIDYQTWKIIILNMQECFTNMIKHSRASLCQVRFNKMNKMIRVSIEDNGRGCSAIKKGLGIQGMEERMASIDGQLIIDGSDGFSTVMLIPVKVVKYES